jgi:small-conductance mechanosensitive channel
MLQTMEPAGGRANRASLGKGALRFRLRPDRNEATQNDTENRQISERHRNDTGQISDTRRHVFFVTLLQKDARKCLQIKELRRISICDNDQQHATMTKTETPQIVGSNPTPSASSPIE